MRPSEFDIEFLRIVRDFRRGGNGPLARQRLSALRTNAMRNNMMSDARFLFRFMKGMR